MITQSRLIELFDYNLDTGIFKRKTSVRNAQAGSVAGCDKGDGYLRVSVDGIRYNLHNLAWLYVTGEYPSLIVDHIDCDRSNNKWSNLRLATKSENCSNRRLASNNTSGYKGVYWKTDKSLWAAEVMKNGKPIRLGYFRCKTAAYLAYKKAARLVHGEFARAA